MATKDQIASTAGQSINEKNVDWLKVMEDGVIVNLHIRRWRAVTRLNMDDLGIPSEQAELSDLFELGDKKLLPADIIKSLNNLETKGRQTILGKYALKTYWGQFVPVTAFEEWLEADRANEADYMAAGRELYNNWDGIVSDLMRSYDVDARNAYRRWQKLSEDRMTEKDYILEDVWVDTFLGRIYSAIPNRDEVLASFGYERELSYIPLPSTLERERTEITRQQETRSREYAETRMQREVIETARREKERLISEFTSSIIGGLNSRVYDAVTDVLRAMNDKDNLHPRSVVQLRNLINQLEKLNFTNDGEIEAMLSTIRGELGKAPESRTASMSERLTDIAVITRDTLKQIGASPRSAREIGIPDAPSLDMVRQARSRISDAQIDLVIELPETNGRKARAQ